MASSLHRGVEDDSVRLPQVLLFGVLCLLKMFSLQPLLCPAQLCHSPNTRKKPLEIGVRLAGYV